jgi:hypothetical protein
MSDCPFAGAMAAERVRSARLEAPLHWLMGSALIGKDEASGVWWGNRAGATPPPEIAAVLEGLRQDGSILS